MQPFTNATVDISQLPFEFEYIKTSGEALPFPDNSFDYVISSDVIEHTPDPLQSTREMIRVLKPGGKIHLKTPTMLNK